MEFISAEEFRKQPDGVHKMCSVEGCACRTANNIVEWCSRHYMQMRKYGKILEETIMDKNVIEIKDGYAEIILKNKKLKEIGRTLIDIEDVEKVKNIKWHLIQTGGYVCGNNKNGKDFLLHRYVMNAKEGELIDHINGDKLNNRKSNLRPVNKSQNAMNSKIPINNTSGVKGVYWDKRSNKWESAIHINGKKKSLGYFKDKEEAIRIRKQAEKDFFKEYARK